MQQYLVIMRMGDSANPEIRRNRAELRDAWLADDPWTKAGVWTDFEIIPFKVSENYVVPPMPGEGS